MTSNEAAERLLDQIQSIEGPLLSHRLRPLIDEALAAERRATVERIRARLQPKLDLVGGDPAYNLSELRRFLDEEAAR